MHFKGLIRQDAMKSSFKSADVSKCYKALEMMVGRHKRFVKLQIHCGLSVSVEFGKENVVFTMYCTQHVVLFDVQRGHLNVCVQIYSF